MKKKQSAFANGVKDTRKIKEKIYNINKARENNGKPPLTKEEARKVAKKVVREESRKRKTRAILVALGILASASTIEGVALLNSGSRAIDKSKNEITLDAEKTDKDINVINIKDRKVFIDGIKVNESNLETIQKENSEPTLEEKVEKEVENLKTSTEVVDYIKTVYAKEYNNEYKTNINKDDIKTHKTRAETSLVEDIDKDGNKIIRLKNKEDGDKRLVDTDGGVITVTVYNENKEEINKEGILNHSGYYKEIQDYGAKVLSNVESIVDTGIDWSTAMDEPGNSKEIKETYKQRFINSIVKYKESQIENIKTESLGEER